MKETTPEAESWAAAGAHSAGADPVLPAVPARHPVSRVVYLKERNLKMMKNDLILRNPLRVMGFESEDILPAGGFGAVLARAGVGKTAFLVQLAINALLRGKNVLHVSLSDPVRKVTLWYEEVFSVLSSISGDYDSLDWYNASSGAWEHWSLDKNGTSLDPANTLAGLDHTMGFYVNVTRACTLIPEGDDPLDGTNNITLRPGWNLVGFPSTQESVLASTALAGISYQRVELYNSSLGGHQVLDPLVDDMVREADHTGFLIHPATPGFQDVECFVTVHADAGGSQNVQRGGMKLFQVIFGKALQAPA